jgi:predicted RNase H-like HicB family nuclease
MKKVKLPVIIERDEDGYFIVSCPLFKGCHTYGETLEEAMENIKEVIDLCLEEKENREALRDFVGLCSCP